MNSGLSPFGLLQYGFYICIYKVTIKEIDTFNVVTYRESFLNVSVMSRALTQC